MLMIKYSGSEYPIRTVEGADNVFIPINWDCSLFRDVITAISRAWPNTQWFISSITHTIDGHLRDSIPGSKYFGPSHVSGNAIDIAPIHALDNPYGRNDNPRLADSIPVMLQLARVTPELQALVAVEGNHLHIDISRTPSIIMVPTYSGGYNNDKRDKISGRPAWRAIWDRSLNAIVVTSDQYVQSIL